MGNLIVIEGIDGTGKSTQYEMLCAELKRRGIPYRNLSFPCYDDESSALVRMYLNKEFGNKPEDVDPYAASVLYACDRFASFRRYWKEDYERGMLFVSCRYTTSNVIHQGSKLRGEERRKYLSWLFDFEYRLMGIPEPSLVCYLQLDAETATGNLRRRESSNGTAPDIHEDDPGYLKNCAEAAQEAAETFGWKIIPCGKNGVMRTRETISADLLAECEPYLH